MVKEEDYREMYEEVKREYDEYKETSEMIESEMEQQIEILKKQNDEGVRMYEERIDKLMKIIEEHKIDVASLERENGRMRDEIKEMKDRLEKAQKLKVIGDVENEEMEQQIRFKDGMIEDLQHQLEKTVEQLTILQIEAEQFEGMDKRDKDKIKSKIELMQSDISSTNRRSIEMILSPHRYIRDDDVERDERDRNLYVCVEEDEDGGVYQEVEKRRRERKKYSDRLMGNVESTLLEMKRLMISVNPNLYRK